MLVDFFLPKCDLNFCNIYIKVPGVVIDCKSSTILLNYNFVLLTRNLNIPFACNLLPVS